MSTTSTTKRKVTRPRIDPKALARYGAGRTLMPLRSATAKDGKLPGRKGWPDRNFVSANVIHNAVIDNVNVGWRLGPEDLVMDVDPRNGGLKSFAILCEEVGLDESKFVKVNSGRGDGGFHLYMKKPANLTTRETLRRLPGIEFKTFGRQVVAAGSLHHATGKPYTFDKNHPRIEDGVRQAPKNLLKLIAETRKANAGDDSGDGVMTAEGAARLLDGLDPADVVPDNAAFEDFAPAAKKACADEEAEAVVLEWLARDTSQEDPTDRWNSYRNDKPGGARPSINGPRTLPISLRLCSIFRNPYFLQSAVMLWISSISRSSRTSLIMTHKVTRLIATLSAGLEARDLWLHGSRF